MTRARLLCLASLALAACDPNGEALPSGPSAGPALLVSPSRLSFGRIAPDATARGEVFVTNVTAEPRTVDVVDLPAWVQREGQGAIEIAPNTSATFGFTVSGRQLVGPARLEGTATVVCAEPPDLEPDLEAACATGLAFSAELGAEPGWTLAPATLGFPAVAVLETESATLLVSNETGEDQTLTGALVGPDADAFAWSPANPNVPTAGTRELRVGFSPRRVGPHAAVLRLEAEDGRRLEVGLSGEGVESVCTVEVAPASLSFGVVRPGQTLERTIALTNLGPHPCRLTVTATPAASTALLRPEVPLELRVPVAETRQIEIEVAPTPPADGLALVVTGNLPTFSVPLSWRSGADATLLIVPNELDFGAVPSGCRPRREITIYNRFDTPVAITGLRAPQGGFQLDHAPLPVEITPAASLRVTVEATPDGGGPEIGALEIRASGETETTYRVPVAYRRAPAGPCP